MIGTDIYSGLVGYECSVVSQDFFIDVTNHLRITVNAISYIANKIKGKSSRELCMSAEFGRFRSESEKCWEKITSYCLYSLLVPS